MFSDQSELPGTFQYFFSPFPAASHHTLIGDAIVLLAPGNKKQQELTVYSSFKLFNALIAHLGRVGSYLPEVFLRLFEAVFIIRERDLVASYH